MTCSHCGQDNRPDAKFCEECGSPLTRRCGRCGTELSARARFCSECATPVLAADRTEPTPATYTPKYLAERILTSKAALEGERKQVTVLFADLKGSMELLADRDPEEARRILDPVLEVMIEAVHRYEGTVNQIMGDGVMALFGAPIAHEDHATRACYAALRMQEGVKEYAEEARRRHGALVQVRVGLNSGEVVVRAIGSDLKIDYSAVGQTTHLAARMEQGAAPGSILLTSSTRNLAEGYVEVRALGPMSVKGSPRPVDVYELIGASSVRSRFQASTVRGLSAFVGRVNEMDVLQQALALARDGHGQVIGMVGEAGVGKSRLYYEFVHSGHTNDCRVVQTSSVSYGKATAYLPLVGLLRGYLGIEATDPDRRIRETVTEKLSSLDRSLDPFIPSILWLLEVPSDGTEWRSLEAVQRRQRMLDAVRRVLIRESQRQPVVIVAEDLHWIDGETQAFLDGLVESVPTARVLLLVNFRPEYQHNWMRKTFYRHVRIDPLSARSARVLIDALLGPDHSLEPLKGFLVERTDGTPFYLEESVRTLIEKGLLVGDPGNRRLEGTMSRIEIPATVNAMLAARIDRLDPETKRVLQAASVIGRDVPAELLRDVVDWDEARLRQHVAELQGAEFIYERLLFPDVEYTFKHALTAEVAYGSLLREQRRELHARVTRSIELRQGDRVEENAERLAFHAKQGELWREAVQYGKVAGKRAIDRAAFGEGARHIYTALHALDQIGSDGAGVVEEGIDLRLSLRGPLWHTGQFSELLDVLRDAEGMARRASDGQRTDQITVLLSSTMWAAGRHEEHRRLITDLERISREPGNPAMEAVALVQLVNVQIIAGEFRRASDLLRSRLDMADAITGTWSLSTSAPGVAFRALLVGVESYLGNFETGMRFGREAVAIADTLSNPVNGMYVADWLSWCYGQRGELAASLALSGGAMAQAEQHESKTLLIPALVQYGWTLCALERGAEGLPFLERGLAEAEEHGVLFFQSMWFVMLAQAHMWGRRAMKAEVLATRGLELARARKEPPWEAWATYVLGEVATASDLPAVAESHFREALTRGDSLGMRPLVAHCHAGLAKMYRRSGKQPAADRELGAAAELYRDMNMAFWLKRAETEMSDLG